MEDEKRLVIENKELMITNCNKLLFPGMTKWEFILHLTRLAPFLLRYTRNRLLTVIRYPDGITGHHFYQKNIPSYAPDWIQTKRYKETTYILLQDTPTLIWLASQAALEYHVSFHLAECVRPTELIFDIDPSVEGFDPVIEVALMLRNVLDEMKLTSIVKTSGATGLQVYVPIERRYSFEHTRRIGKFVANYLLETAPRLVTLERLKQNRGEKVYIDYLQHWHGKSIIAPYSPRARAGAPVATPLTWSEIERGARPEHYTLETIHERIANKGDLFASALAPNRRQSLDHILSVITS